MTTILESIQTLNDKQRQAVLTTQGPLLIAAGAGSGKTRVLTHRIAYLIEQENVNPWNILAITFTNKAAREMKERIERLVGPHAESIWVSTFHAMCARILRREALAIGYDQNFSIIDQGQQQTLMKQILKELNLDSQRFNYKEMLAVIDTAKNEGKLPQEFESTAFGYMGEIQASVYHKYQKALKQSNAMDFNDLILYSVKLLQDREDIRMFYQQKFQYIHVDEYQDTNESQYQLVQLLAGTLRNVCVVGDADQSIYGWRGANMENILNFEKDYPDATVILLEQNYRSTQNILNAANSVIEHNKVRKPKKLWSDKDHGDKVRFHLAETDTDEARFVIQEILTLKQDKGVNNDSFAILYRTQAQSRSLEEQLLNVNLPYRVVGGLKFYARKEIQDTLAYLHLINNSQDNLSFNRIINVPKRGIGQASVEKLAAFADSMGLSWYEAIASIDVSNISGRTRSKFIEFHQMIENLKHQAQFLTMTDLVQEVWKQTSYIHSLREEGSLEALNRIENLEEFESVTHVFDQEADDIQELDPDFIEADQESQPESLLTKFLTQLSLATDQEDDQQEQAQITLMTMHAAKGLEFPYVFIVGLEEGLFPLRRAMELEEELEEERRLAYVGMTRAEQKLYLSACRSRLLYGRYQQNMISRFIDEIEADYIDKHQAANPFVQSRLSDDRRYGSVKVSHQSSRQQAHKVSLSGSRPQRSQSKKVTVQANDQVSWSVGQMVDHKAWGQGEIIKVVDSGGDQLLSIVFPEQGEKQVLAKFAPIRPAE